MEIFPNPVNNKININFEKETKVYSIQVFDFSGRILQNKGFSNLRDTKVQIDLSDLPYGIYPGYVLPFGKL
ncbi:MAG: T9SS type A sorting domain-containing protein [Flammeovirgaceae bacterium]|nr:T9SS type A sorting domain-containing protein [Flammeovirgaceae bacterium]